MLNKKNLIVMIFGFVYVTLFGFLIPYLIINFNLYEGIYDFMYYNGSLFLIYIITTILFFPFIYSTIVKGRLSLNIRGVNKKRKSPHYLATILFIIGIPLMIWLIVAINWYYSITEFSGGFGELAINGFLVLFMVLIYFCIIPAIVLSCKKGKPPS